MTTAIILASIAVYLVGFGLTWRHIVRRCLRTALTLRIERAETLWADVRDSNPTKRKALADARELRDVDRSEAFMFGTALGLFWPLWWIIDLIRTAIHLTIDSIANEVIDERRELEQLRSIAKAEGWEL